MGDKIDLLEKEAVDKLKEVIIDASICVFVSSQTVTPMSGRAMAGHRLDSEGNLWFLSPSSSNKTREIEDDTRVQLFFSNSTNSKYLSIYGLASIINNKELAVILWNTELTNKTLTNNYSLLKVTPVNAQYWDTTVNKMSGLIDRMADAIAGKMLDESNSFA